MKYLRINNVSIHINFYQSWFKINVLERLFFNSRTDVNTEYFLWDVEELTFLITKLFKSMNCCIFRWQGAEKKKGKI